MLSIQVNPRHLIASAFLNAPAAFVMSKIHYPETSKSQLKTEEPLKEKKKGYGTYVHKALRNST